MDDLELKNLLLTKTDKEIRRILHIGSSELCRLKKLHEAYKTNKWNDLFLDEWNQASAYIIGFWLADGSMQIVGNSKIVRFYNSDRSILEYIKKSADMTNKIYSYKRGSYKTEYVLNVNSHRWFDRLSYLGFEIGKSNKPCPIQLEVPKNVFHHFIRG